MARKQRGATGTTPLLDGPVPQVGPREPCPCGSGKRYKVCHGRAARASSTEHVRRPFEGLPGEADWVALREIVPAATATVRTSAEHGGHDVTVATVLPLAWPGLHRADGELMVGLQTQGSGGDPSRELAAAVLAVVASEPGQPVERLPRVGPDTPRLQDVLDLDVPLTVRVCEGFDFWLPEGTEPEGDVAASLQRANEAVVPTERLASVEGAYWCRIGERTHLRWVLTEDEDALLDALARLHAAGGSSLGDHTRYVGAFRAHGLLVPVWDLPGGATADDVEEPAAAFRERLSQALGESAPLTPEERRARAGVVSRQVTLR